MHIFLKFQNAFRNLSFRTKLASVFTLLIGVISVFMSFYFPVKLEGQAMSAISANAKNITAMTAYSISPALFFNDLNTIEEEVQSAKQNKDLAYLILLDGSGKEVYKFISPFVEQLYSQNVDLMKLRSSDENIYHVSMSIFNRGHKIGTLHTGFSLLEIHQEISSSRSTIILMSILTFLFGMIAVFGISTLVSRPLNKMVRTVKKIADGDLTQRAPITSKDEIGNLAASFNVMIDALEERKNILEREITERINAEEKLRIAEIKFRNIFEGAVDGIFQSTVDGKFMEVNPALARMVGFDSPQQMIETVQDISSQFYAAQSQRMEYQKLLNTHGEVTGYESQILRKDGTHIWISENARLVRDSSGKPVYYEGTVEDITDRKNAEEKLRVSEEMFRNIVEGTHAILFNVTTRGQITYLNDAACRKIGLPYDALIGRLYLKFVHQDDRQKVSTFYRKQISEKLDNAIIEFRFINSSGTEHWLSCVSNPIFRDGEIITMSIIAQDITDRKKAEQEITLLAHAIKSSADCVSITDSLNRILFLNDAFLHTYEYEAAELLGKSINVVRTQNQDSDLVEKIRLSTLQGGWKGELMNRKKDGTEFPISLSTSIVYNNDKEPFALIGIARDISERKKAEEKLQERSRELQLHNEELDAFSHTVAHDLKNPVALLFGYGTELEENYHELSDEERILCVKAIPNIASKMNNIIDELLLLASVRKMEVEMYPINMRTIINEAQNGLARMIQKSQAKIIIQKDFPEALGYAPWLEEVWMNYISNAIKYGGKPPQLDLGSDVQSDGMIRFWIRDNGIGLSSEQISKMFIPFTRLNQVKIEGHGLGLSVVRRIIDKLNGQVRVESEVGKGSTFSFTLPQC